MMALLKDDGDEEPEYAAEDDEEEGEPNGVSARLMFSLIFHIMY
jgi:hypothetical protein